MWYHDLAHAATAVNRVYFEAHQALGAETAAPEQGGPAEAPPEHPAPGTAPPESPPLSIENNL